MALSRSQARHYHHAVDIWRRAPSTLVRGADKGITDTTGYALLASSVPCRMEAGKGMSVPKKGVGRADYDIVITSDEVHFGHEVDIQDADVLKFVSPADDPKYGEFWIVQGEPQRVGKIGRRYGGRKTVTAARQQKAPQGVS